MPFGIESAPEEFQRRLDEYLEVLQNIAVTQDDVIVFGSENPLKRHPCHMTTLSKHSLTDAANEA